MKVKMKKIYLMKSLEVRKAGKGMKCSHCGKEIADISFSFKLGERYYCNELCYFESVRKDFNKKINKMLQYYYSFNDKNVKVPKQYYMLFNKLRKEYKDEKYTMFFLYNSRDIINEINNRYQYCKVNTRIYKVWEYLRDNYYLMLPQYFKKTESISHIFESENKDRVIKKRHKNRLLED